MSQIFQVAVDGRAPLASQHDDEDKTESQNCEQFHLFPPHSQVMS